MDKLRKYFPIFEWGAEYSSKTFINDLITGVIVTMMLIPQSLAYAQLAGLPAEVGLYASIAPLIMYAIFGTSRTLAVGPVAVGSLMTAAAVAPLAAQGTPEYLGAAIALALISGLMLIVMGSAETRIFRKLSQSSGYRRFHHCFRSTYCSKPAGTSAGHSHSWGESV